MKRIFVNELCLEVTRRCNMGCAHCLRGDAQDVDVSHTIIDEIFNQVDGIGQVTFTGGEPSLNISAIRYFFQRAERTNKMPRSFFVATNGKANQEQLAVALLYVSANGNIVGNCDMSYERIDAEAAYSIHDFRWEVEKTLAELA